MNPWLTQCRFICKTMIIVVTIVPIFVLFIGRCEATELPSDEAEAIRAIESFVSSLNQHYNIHGRYPAASEFGEHYAPLWQAARWLSAPKVSQTPTGYMPIGYQFTYDSPDGAHYRIDAVPQTLVFPFHTPTAHERSRLRSLYTDESSIIRHCIPSPFPRVTAGPGDHPVGQKPLECGSSSGNETR